MPQVSRLQKRRVATIALAALSILALGLVINRTPGRGVDVQRVPAAPPPSFEALPAPHPRSTWQEEPPDEATPGTAAGGQPSFPSDTKQEQEQLIKGLLVPIKKANQAGRHQQAIAMLDHSRTVLKDAPEAYLQMGIALRGAGDAVTAANFFLAAINRDPYLDEAYFEFATTAEQLGDLEAALGGMRNYLHVVKDRTPYRLKIARARAAIWELESKLGRGEWGASKGIPPGFTAEELRRDGKGVGIKMPIPGTERPDGSFDYEIRSADKQEIFKK